MKTIAFTAIAAAALLLGGCNTFMEDVTAGALKVQPMGAGKWHFTSGRLDVDDTERRMQYQGAVTAKAHGYGWFQILSFEDGTLGLGTGANMTVAGIHDPASPAPCTAKSGFEWRCKPQNADAAIARLAPLLHKTPAQIAEDIRLAGLPPAPPAK